ncbi:MAG: DUF87 domain-containing protein [Pseudomonadota bacterium]
MKVSYRLATMLMSLAIIIVIGRWATGAFSFATAQFWFISGALLLILLSLVDQPHFSKDANVFVNGAAALVSLFSVPDPQRSGLWSIFAGWAIYLIVCSWILMAIRSRALFLETKTIQFFSRVNRAIGRPESIFSAFFLWGIFLQFSYPKDGIAINTLLLFWAVFMILNVPSIAQAVSSAFEETTDTEGSAGVVVSIRSPRIAELRLSADLPEDIVGKKVSLRIGGETLVAEGVLFEDKVVKGLRQGHAALTSFQPAWSEVSSGARIEIALNNAPVGGSKPIGVVAAGSSIGKLFFEVDPRTALHAGEVVKVKASSSIIYYQIVSASINESTLPEGNASQMVRVTAGQLGLWDSGQATFAPFDWVASAGEVVVVSRGEEADAVAPAGRCVVGLVPNSQFPVHVHVSDTITHNSALIGVTGSGKSYLAFHLIEAYIDAGVKVLILDLTRQHWQYLQHRNPTALTGPDGIAAWLASDSRLAIHQFANAQAGFPAATANFCQACLDWLQAGIQLQAGVDVPARLCIVLEEAHSLIPEWNQVAQQSDVQQVNRAARIILQGRKFGLGTMIITQRTANVTKTILNQCNTVFALRSFDQTGLDFLRNYMGEEYAQAISTLPDRTAILVGKASSSARPIILKVSDFGDRWNANQAPAEVPVA